MIVKVANQNSKNNQAFSKYLRESKFEVTDPNKNHNQPNPNKILKYNIDAALTEIPNKHTDNILVIIQELVLEHIEKYRNTIHIYTDGSKCENGSVGAAVF